jgi:predicted nucleic acid-binding protein
LDALAKLKQLEHDQPHSITRFTISELLLGVELAEHRASALEKLHGFIDYLQILEFDADSMRWYPRIYARLKSLNRLSGVMDMLTASVAVANHQRLVTRNPRHFELIPGLRVDAY